MAMFLYHIGAQWSDWHRGNGFFFHDFQKYLHNFINNIKFLYNEWNRSRDKLVQRYATRTYKRGL